MKSSQITSFPYEKLQENPSNPSETENPSNPSKPSKPSKPEKTEETAISSLSLFSSKKISKITKKSNKSRFLAIKPLNSPPQAKYSMIFNPKTFLSPFSTHRMEGDLFLYDMTMDSPNEAKGGLIANFNSCKQIMSSIHDKTLKTIHFKVESHDTTITPIELMVNRLNSLNNIYAHELAETVKYYGLSLDFLKKIRISEEPPAKNHPVFKDYQMKCKKIYEKFGNSGFVFSAKTTFNVKKCRFEVMEISFNELLVKMLGVSNEKFIRNTMKNGFPDVIHINSNYHEWHASFLQMTGAKGTMNSDKALNCDFLAMGDTVKIPCKVIVESVSVQMENYLENTMFMVCVPIGESQKMAIEQENTEDLGNIEKNLRNYENKMIYEKNAIFAKNKGNEKEKEKNEIFEKSEKSEIFEKNSTNEENSIYDEKNEISDKSFRNEEKSLRSSKEEELLKKKNEFLKKYYPLVLKEEDRE